MLNSRIIILIELKYLLQNDYIKVQSVYVKSASKCHTFGFANLQGADKKLFAAPRGKLFDTLHFLTAVNLLLRGLIFIPSHRSNFLLDSDLILVGPTGRAAATDTIKSL